MSSSLRVFIIDMSELVKLYSDLSEGEEPEIVVTDDSLRCGDELVALGLLRRVLQTRLIPPDIFIRSICQFGAVI